MRRRVPSTPRRTPTPAHAGRVRRREHRRPSHAGACCLPPTAPCWRRSERPAQSVASAAQARFAVKIRNAGASTANNVVVTINMPENVEITAAEATRGHGSDAAPPASKTPRSNGRSTGWKAKSGETLELGTGAAQERLAGPGGQLDLHARSLADDGRGAGAEAGRWRSPGPTEVLYGQSKIYKLTVSNPGNGDTENVVIGLLPIGRAVMASPATSWVRCTPVRAKPIDVELTARQAGTIAIKAQAYADGGLRTEAAEQVLVRRASLHVEVEAPKVKYRRHRRHLSGQSVKTRATRRPTDVQVAAMLPPDAKYHRQHRRRPVRCPAGQGQLGGRHAAAGRRADVRDAVHTWARRAKTACSSWRRPTTI